MGQDKWVVSNGIHDIDALVLQKIISTFRLVENESSSLKSDELRSCEKSSFFLRWVKTNGKFPLVYMILIPLFHEKSISTFHFGRNQSSNLKRDELHS